MLYPLVFRPIFQERIWGGRRLAELYGKPLPPDVPIGESWEISDRPGAVSVIVNGALAGQDLHWLVENHAAELLGAAPASHGRFPLLVKILDAREALSLQVHPPAAKAAELSGEPKTEVWYVAEAAPGAQLYAGLRRGVTRAEFERKLRAGTVAECFHRLAVKAGDALFLPSGRVHALGAGLVVFEIQQSSETTYRVFDWQRTGRDGRGRELHLAEALASIDFDDFEPRLVGGEFAGAGPVRVRPLVSHPLFNAEAWQLEAETEAPLGGGKMHILGLVSGRARVRDARGEAALAAGQFCVVPAVLQGVQVRAETAAVLLRTEAGSGQDSPCQQR
jgi:mannose-6-phosphate isomerase